MLESTTTLSADISKNVAEMVYKAISKFVPVKTIVESVLAIDETAGKDPLDNYSYKHKDVSVFTHGYVVVPSFTES